jgi:glycosyltransferase involved in cell wall biosynthesis
MTNNTDKKLIIYIPAYNAAITLPKVLDRIPSHILSFASKILVVDNHSSDETQKVALNYKEKNSLDKLTVIRNEKNLGYGGSQKVAYRYCIENGYDYVVMLHADGQYSPELLEKIISTLIDTNSDMVFGSRMAGNPLKGGMPLHRYLGNRFLTTLQNITLGTKLTEFHSGYRVFRVDALKDIPFNNLSDNYHFDTEVIILLKHMNKKITEITIPTFYGDEENYVNIWKYGTDVVVTTMTYAFHVHGLRKSKNWGRILRDHPIPIPSKIKIT